MMRRILAQKVNGGGGEKPEMVELHISDERLHACGVFSNVYRARLCHPEERLVAIKKTWPKVGQRNNDLHFLRQFSHPNIVELLYYFHIAFDEDRRCDCVVFEFLPLDLAKVQKTIRPRPMDLLDIKLYTWQMFCALDYLNGFGIAHRDVKPSNLLCDPQSGILKLGDFGSAKLLVRAVRSTSYQVTRYYRAPELLFESIYYTPAIDIWAGACVLGELLIGSVMLEGCNKDDQTRIIIELFGFPTAEECAAMRVARPHFARRPARGIRNVGVLQRNSGSFTRRFMFQLFPNRTPEDALELLESLLRYAPNKRLVGAAILNHRFFDDLRAHPRPIRTNGHPLPPLFDQSMQSNINEAPNPQAASPANPH